MSRGKFARDWTRTEAPVAENARQSVFFRVNWDFPIGAISGKMAGFRHASSIARLGRSAFRYSLVRVVVRLESSIRRGVRLCLSVFA